MKPPLRNATEFLTRDCPGNRLRLSLPFPATVRGNNAQGQPFVEMTVLREFSTCRLSLWLHQPLEVGTRLFVVIRLALTAEPTPAPRIALYGIVARAQDCEHDLRDVVIEVVQHRFLYRR